MGRASDYALNSQKQRAAVGSHRQSQPCVAHRLDFSERAGINQSVAADLNRDIVAAMFSLLAYLSRQAPDRRVIKKKYLDRRLQQVYQVIISADVRKFVRDDGFKLAGREPHERACGN